MRIVRVSETLFGTPMIEIEPEPLDASGTLCVSDKLAELLEPYMTGRDNIAVRFTGRGLPTTATAVITEMYVKLGDPPDLLRWYSLRAMVFETPTGKTGMNAYFKPIRTEFVKLPVGQNIENGPIYNFREVYDNMESISNDMDRLLNIADSSFSKTIRPK